ncbi:uncharacterized protein LOC123515964 [Portunus trituberculatus]|uniref:uncharacterized protein LOC123515964 n=1 Tax=Portunus trituberculatus TaxID=210409 RepID=UPI001E1D0219|nr:uncharacterized protein LOC123515964 [Portunus trituberculatus]
MCCRRASGGDGHDRRETRRWRHVITKTVVPAVLLVLCSVNKLQLGEQCFELRPATSYLGIMADQPSLDLRLIPEYDGSGAQSVVEWIEKLELICKLRNVSDVASVIPLRLSGGAFAVYLQLAEAERKKVEKIKALVGAFAMDSYIAYKQFICRKLQAGESPDVFLAELRHLASLFGGMSEKGLACAFVAGLPEGIRRLLRAGSRMETLDLPQILAQTRAVVHDDGAGGVHEVCFSARAGNTNIGPDQRCFVCNGVNHFARDCLAHQDTYSGRSQRSAGHTSRRGVRCYRCGVRGHIALAYPGNDRGGEASAPASSLDKQ